MRHLLPKKRAQNGEQLTLSHYRIRVKERQYTARNVNRSNCARQLQHTTGQPVNQILHAVDNNTLYNIPILGEDVVMDEKIYGLSVPHLQGKPVRHKV